MIPLSLDHVICDPVDPTFRQHTVHYTYTLQTACRSDHDCYNKKLISRDELCERYRLNHAVVVKLYHPYTQFPRKGLPSFASTQPAPETAIRFSLLCNYGAVYKLFLLLLLPVNDRCQLCLGKDCRPVSLYIPRRTRPHEMKWIYIAPFL